MRNYRMLTGLITPLVPVWLEYRRRRGKEDPARLKERLGFASVKRPPGILLWLHAASVGEANSVLLVIEKIRERFPHIAMLLTTGTVTSAKLMQARLPAGVIHQYAPVDTPQAARRFIRYWRPEFAFWVESEFWPNVIREADRRQCFMGVINGRLSERSFRSWQKRPDLIRRMLSCFDIIFAQSDEDARRLKTLGGKDALCVGNLKYDAALLPCNESELMKIKNAIGPRPVWLAASTHPGEEAMVATAHKSLAVKHPTLLTILVPRHPERGAAIAQALKKNWQVALRSKQEPVTPDTDIYIADTLGELGLFYRLCEIVFMGGSLVKHGGQNPLEAARLACGIIAGPHTHNFSAIYQEMEKLAIVRCSANAQNLAAEVALLLENAETLDKMQTTARAWVERQGGAAQRLLDILSPLFEPAGKSL